MRIRFGDTNMEPEHTHIRTYTQMCYALFTLTGLSLPHQLLEEGGLDTLTEVVVAAIKSYCSSEVCDIEGKEDNEAVTKRSASQIVSALCHLNPSLFLHRHTHLTFDPSEDVAQPVFDLDSLECGQDCVQIPFYVEVLQNDGEDDESDVLDKGDTLAAVQVPFPLFTCVCLILCKHTGQTGSPPGGVWSTATFSSLPRAEPKYPAASCNTGR